MSAFAGTYKPKGLSPNTVSGFSNKRRVAIVPSVGSFDGDDTALVYGTGWNNNNVASEDGKIAASASASVEFEALGTTIDIRMYLSDGLCDIYVDGVLVLEPATNATWHTETVALGSDSWHRIKIIASSSTFQTWISKNSNALQLTGTAPSIRKPTGASGVNLAGTYYLGNATGVQYDGSCQTTAFFSSTDVTDVANQDARYRMVLVPDGSGNTMSISMRAYPWGATGYRCTVDGLEDGTYGSQTGIQSYPANSGITRGFPWITLISGITAGSNREVGIWITMRDNNQPSIHSDFILNNCTLGTAPTAAKKIVAFGDSITAGKTGITCDLGYIHKLCLLLDAPSGRAPLNYGVDGSEVNGLADATVDAAALIAVGTGDIFIVAYGANDVINGKSAATFQSQLTTELNYILTKTSKQIYVIQYTESNNGASAGATAMASGRVAYKAAYQAAIAACTTPSQCTFISTDGLFTSIATDTQSDGVHPTAAGMTKLAAYYATVIT